MSEEFANSGWKEKKLWKPEPEEDKGRGKGKGTRGIASGLEAEQLRAKAAAQEPPPEREPPRAREPAPPVAESSIRLASVRDAPAKAKAPRQPRSPRGPLEVLDPESSSEEDEAPMLPPEFAVLDMNVPRTALVINVSHVLKRLSGCCSLNQLTKALKTFKENSAGVTLEQFLRANPDTFELEGRIVHLLDRSGDRWKPPPPEELPEKGRGKGRGKGKGDGKGQGKGKSDGAGKGGGKDRGKGSQQAHGRHRGGAGGGGDSWDYYYDDASWWDSAWYASEWSGGGGAWKGSKWKEQAW